MAEARGILLVVSSPSGAGKTTLCHRLTDEFPRLGYSVSYTTRPPRGGEEDGRDYHFVQRAVFEEMTRRGELAEWAEVHGNLYGTARSTVDGALGSGRDLLFDIDWQGALQLERAYPSDTTLVFIVPPSMAELEARLRGRGTDAPEVVARRLAAARAEIERSRHYGFVVVNDDLERAHRDLRAVYLAAHLTPERQAPAVAALLAR